MIDTGFPPSGPPSPEILGSRTSASRSPLAANNRSQPSIVRKYHGAGSVNASSKPPQVPSSRPRTAVAA